MNKTAPLSAENLMRLTDFVTESERSELEQIAQTFMESGVLMPNPAGPKRFFAKVYGTEHCVPLLSELGNRVAVRLGLEDFKVDGYFGHIVSLIEPGGFIHEHIDRYGVYNEGMKHLRCNIMVCRENGSYDPIISHMIVPIPECSAWAFIASECKHGTQAIAGNGPRIIVGFGWEVPADYSLAKYLP